MALPGIPPAPVGAKSDKAPKTLILSDFPAGGSIGVATDTVDRFEKINIAQTTADQILTLPNAEKNKIVYIQNTGTAAFTTNTIELNPGEFSLFVFSGTFWARPLQGQGGGTGSAAKPPFTLDFIVADWVLNAPNYEIVISAAQHGFSSDIFDVIIFEEVAPREFKKIIVDNIHINHTSKSVIVSVPSTPEARFNGRIGITAAQSLQNSKIDTAFEGALLGTESVTFSAEQLEGKTHFIISAKLYSHWTSVTVPIRDYVAYTDPNNPLNNTLSIMCGLGSWFDQTSRAELGCIEASYNTQTRVFKVEQIFYRHSNAWGTKQIRNNSSSYFVSKIEVM